MDYSETKTYNVFLFSFRNDNAKPPQYVLNEKFEILTNFTKSNTLIIQNPDEGKSLVIIDKDFHLKCMKKLIVNRRSLKTKSQKNNIQFS